MTKVAIESDHKLAALLERLELLYRPRDRPAAARRHRRGICR